MTATPAELAALFADANRELKEQGLPGGWITRAELGEVLAEMGVEWTPGDVIASNDAMVLTGNEHGETVLIANYYKGATARPLYCPRDGAQRHDRVGKRWKCAVCGGLNG